jgi:hypothetical protein
LVIVKGVFIQTSPKPLVYGAISSDTSKRTSVSVVTAFDDAVKLAVKELAGTETDEGTDSRELSEPTETVTGIG